ncbi:MAG: hypothetical protein IKQ54_08370 [Oscillospiraceae bacterium]|nr:hypothetical protein [Oscillospiraceae bacterium]
MVTNMNYLELAGVCLAYQPRYPQTAHFFSDFSLDGAPAQAAAGLTVTAAVPVSIPPADWTEYLADGMEDCPHTEYSMLTEYFSDALLPFDRVILHGVALRWRNRAFLICAESGVGKSTQASFLQELRPGEFGIICGDRPILSFHDKEIIVHSSPWNGKENWKGAAAAPLSGIIMLERGPQNKLYSLTEQEAGIPFYNHVIQSAWDPENVCRVASMITRLLYAVPIWKLVSNEVPASTRLLLESVF